MNLIFPFWKQLWKLRRFTFYYHPQGSLGKVMFLHVSVILFTGGGWYPSMPCRSPGGSPGPHPGGGWGVWSGGSPGLHLGRVSRSTPWGVSQHALRQTSPRDFHAGRYSQQAGSTYPTGMHSCSQKLPSDLHIIVPDMPGHGNTDRVELEDDIYPLLVRKLHQVLQKDQVYITDKGRKLRLFIFVSRRSIRDEYTAWKMPVIVHLLGYEHLTEWYN